MRTKLIHPTMLMNDRETALCDLFHCTIAKRRPAREARCAAAWIEDQAAIGRSRQKIFQFILRYRPRAMT